MSTANTGPTVGATRAEIERVFALQREHQWIVRASDAETRKKRLSKLKAALLAHSEEVVEAMAADLGRPGSINEIFGPVAKIDKTITLLDEWMAPQPVTDVALASAAAVRYEARGVVLLFGPWNFPIGLLFEPLVTIIAAGNTAIVKPNELAPTAASLSARIIREVFDEDEVAVIEGGVEVAEVLLEQPFDHIFLTGSPKVGRAVMAAAAKNLASVTLELGGKSPAIVDSSSDLEVVAKQIGEAKMINDGQVCLSVDYVLVHRSHRDQLVAHLAKYFSSAYYEDGAYASNRAARLVNLPNFRRVAGYIADAIARGAKVAFGGQSDENARVIEPTILIDVPHDADVLREEIFGPILPVVVYDDITDAIEHIRRGTKPLAMYIFSKDDSVVERVLASTSSGGVTVNTAVSLHYWEDALPFGGIGDSGIGRYHGVHGFRELSHARAIAYK